MYGMNGLAAPQTQSLPAAKGQGNRRQVIQQIIHNNGSGNILFSSGGAAAPNGAQAGRRGLNTYTSTPGGGQYGSQQYNSVGKAYQNPIFKQQEREEIKNLYRNLKIQYNITNDENTRLRTRVQAMHIDLCKKEKDIENLTRQLQQQANYLSAGGHAPVSQKTNYLESFLVQQLKR